MISRMKRGEKDKGAELPLGFRTTWIHLDSSRQACPSSAEFPNRGTGEAVASRPTKCNTAAGLCKALENYHVDLAILWVNYPRGSTCLSLVSQSLERRKHRALATKEWETHKDVPCPTCTPGPRGGGLPVSHSGTWPLLALLLVWPMSLLWVKYRAALHLPRAKSAGDTPTP